MDNLKRLCNRLTIVIKNIKWIHIHRTHVYENIKITQFRIVSDSRKTPILKSFLTISVTNETVNWAAFWVIDSDTKVLYSDFRDDDYKSIYKMVSEGIHFVKSTWRV